MKKIVIDNVADLIDPSDPEGRSYRELNNLKSHKFRAGQLVEIDDGVRLYVEHLTRDCDGTPLYVLSPFKVGFSPSYVSFSCSQSVQGVDEDSMTLVTDYAP